MRSTAIVQDIRGHIVALTIKGTYHRGKIYECYSDTEERHNLMRKDVDGFNNRGEALKVLARIESDNYTQGQRDDKASIKMLCSIIKIG